MFGRFCELVAVPGVLQRVDDFSLYNSKISILYINAYIVVVRFNYRSPGYLSC